MKKLLLPIIGALCLTGFASDACAQKYYARQHLSKTGGSSTSPPATDPDKEPDYGDLSEYLDPMNNAAMGYAAFTSRYGDIPYGMNTVSSVDPALFPGPLYSSKIQVYPHFYAIDGVSMFSSQDGIPAAECARINALYGSPAVITTPSAPRGCISTGGRNLVYITRPSMDAKLSGVLSATGSNLLAYVRQVGAAARARCGANNATCANNPGELGYANATGVPQGLYFRNHFIGIGSQDGRYNGPATAWDGVSRQMCEAMNGGNVPVWPDRESGCFLWYSSYQIYSYAHNPR